MRRSAPPRRGRRHRRRSRHRSGRRGAIARPPPGWRRCSSSRPRHEAAAPSAGPRSAPAPRSARRIRRRSQDRSAAASAAADSVGGSAIVQVKVAPCPGVLSRLISPPIASTRRFEIASPRPVPPNRRPAPPSACSNSSKMRACSLRRDADAGVADAERQGAVRRRLDRDRDAAGFGELDGIADQVEQHLAQAGGVADDAVRGCVVDERGDFDALGMGARRQQLDHVLDQRAQRERLDVEIEPARLDLGKIEDVLDQAEPAPRPRISPPWHRSIAPA